ncbi:hypothetical protein CONLIGDRAFT_633681 [Coniochaeta ligniaria NRRL 30616]|uniref:MINDY deubiquitinase domain-containing protein n=1 Tax=Coniochaeta ligniaria NRRL 30616 TaxID=1408157 RepID=A0A1J7JDK1_9PEZI|nr:hypothetical protein CONLIGDRAFT_633681 [Coniochaeta ligniaria NRRL 30616]
MVTRKPLPENATVDPNAPSARGTQDTRQELWSATESEASADQIWAAERQDQIDESQPRTLPPQDIPNALRPGMPPPANYSSLETEENVWGDTANPAAPATGETEQRAKADVNRVPTVLRPGGGATRPETNPFKRKPPGTASIPRKDATTEPPTTSFSQLSVEETGSNPWGPAVAESQPQAAPPPVPAVLGPETGKDIWDSAKSSRQPTPGAPSASPGLVSVPSESGSAVWDEKPPMRAPTPEEKIALDEEQELEDSHIWDDLGTLDKGKGPSKPPPPMTSQSSGGRIDEWSLIDHDGPRPAPPSRRDTWENFDDAPEVADSSASPQHTPEEEPPSLPPRRAEEQTPARPVPAQPPRQVAEPKNETYQIKLISWHDVEAAKNPRQSPILVQNANGPCPLVALVNALTLTTPAGINTALVETLRTREQVSLSLVIDAVFDELMSSRRTNPNAELPDVAELYEFLKGLHTGMNVNPRFIPTEDLIKAFKRTSLTHLHPTERNDTIPGTFEDTQEMRLYSTFAIPLIHGWLPPKSDPVYDAFARRAASYEDVQNLLFMEEELEDKLSSPHHRGLTEEEQAVYQDVLTIKSFLSASATQLTPWGLQTIRQAMRPGSVAILFRNDHFSTLYRHPQTHELLTLVTDAGYASHEEVVWESLVDVNGEHAEFFSGDFRLVGGASHHIDQPAQGSSSASGGAWTTVQGRRGRGHTQNPSADDHQPPLSATHEQEDRDLALAMQLQEEEDERARAEQARRRRESMLSEQFIEQQGRQPAAAAGGRGGGTPQNGGGRGANRNTNNNHNRRSSNTLNTTPTNASTTSVSSRGSSSRGGRAAPTTQTVRSLIPPRGGTAVNRPADEGEDEAPPSYEQAAKQVPYVPPAAGQQSGIASASSVPRRTSAAASSAPRPGMLAPGPVPGRQGSTSSYPGSSGGSGRATGGTPTGQQRVPPMRQGVPMGAAGAGAGGRERDRECVVM